MRTKPQFTEDPFNELSTAQRLAGLKQRFPDRVLIMTTNKCFGYCAHCTRRWILGKAKAVETAKELSACVDYVKAHPKVRDVLLSGGDVLTLSDERIMEFVNAFDKLPQVEMIRICTRALVAKPKRITKALVKALARSKKIWVNVHINTADEALIAKRPAALFIEQGIPVSSQTVLLRGVNDTREKMLKLLQVLSAERIRPYYVFQCDPVKGLEHLRVPLSRAKAIERYCAEHIGGLALPRFVEDIPNSLRKVPLDLI